MGVEAADLCAGLMRSLQLRLGSGLEPLSRYAQAYFSMYSPQTILMFLPCVSGHAMLVPSSVAQYCPQPCRCNAAVAQNRLPSHSRKK